MIPLVLLGAALQNACTCEAPQRLRLGIMQHPACQPLLLAAHFGFFEKHGLAVEIQTFKTRAEATQASAAQKLDGLCLNLAELLVLPQDYKIILIPAYSQGADVLIARKDVGTDLNDLKGARIGVPPVSMGDVLLNRALAQHTLEREDFTILPEEPQDLQDSLQKSEIQLAVAAPPYSLDILKNPEMTLIFRSTDMPFEILDTISLRADRVQALPQLVTKLESVWQDTMKSMQDGPEAAFALLEATSKIPAATYQQDYKFLTTDEQRAYLLPEGRLLPMIDALQSSLMLSGNLKIQRPSPTFLAIPTRK